MTNRNGDIFNLNQFTCKHVHSLMRELLGLLRLFMYSL